MKSLRIFRVFKVLKHAKYELLRIGIEIEAKHRIHYYSH